MTALKNYKGLLFTPVRDVAEGAAFYFLAGRTICIEKYSFVEGATEFDYSVNSRVTRDGQPEKLMAMANSLRNEFFVHRIASRYPIPFNFGKTGTGSALDPNSYEWAITYGEVAPQIFESKQGLPSFNGPIAWSVRFKRAWVNSNPSPTSALNRLRQGVSRPSARRLQTIGRSDVPNSAYGARLDALASDFFLRIWINALDEPVFKALAEPVGEGDVIFQDPTLLDRLQGLFGQ